MGKKKTLVPRLRFPEFRDAGGWEVKPLSDCCFLQAGKFVRANKIYEVASNDRYPCYGGNGLRGYTTSFTHEGLYSLIGRQGAQCGNVNLVKGKFYATEHAVVVAPKYGLNTLWLFYKLTQMNLNQYATGQAQPGLSVENIEKLIVRLPEDEKEQQKIADCLSTLDKLITAQAEKIDALKIHKKGLMQRIFPREGETVPRLRFPEFREAEEWKASHFGELGVFTGGGTPSKSKPAYWQGDIPWVSSSDISDESIRTVTITRFITKQAIKKSATKLIPSGSILLVSRVGVGKLAIIESPVCTSQDFTNFIPSKDSPIFLGYYLKSNGPRLENLCQGMAIKGFTKEDISKMELFVPRGDEQQKIADCLSSLDELIVAHVEKLDVLKNHKKGLMQKLFPSPETVSV